MAFMHAEALALVKAGSLTPEQAADRLLAEMTASEQLGLLDGDLTRFQILTIPKRILAGPITAGAVPRLGIPGTKFVDGPRGVVAGPSTAFPVTMARAATWDPALERQVGLAMGREGRAQGGNYSGAVCINLLRHPAWGRAQECYGEDPVLVGAMGVGLTQGLRPNVMACVKHYALNSMENARFKVDVRVDQHALHEVYLPHFKAVIDAGADSVMSAYNKVNGDWAGESRELLTDILRDEWGFRGYVTSDWMWGIRDPIKSLEAGMDVEMPVRLLRARVLPKALRDGRITRDLVLRSGRAILATQLRHAAERDAAEPSRDVLANAEHRALARLVAARGMVLLKNDAIDGDRPLLPLDKAAAARIVVIGHLATEPNTGDHGSSLVHPPTTCSPLAGITEAFSAARVEHDGGSDPIAAARRAADADVAVVVVGMTHDDEGERVMNDNVDGTAIFGFPFNLRPVQWAMKKLAAKVGSQFGLGGDRERLTLKPADEALIAAVAAANPRTIVIVIGGSAILMEAWRAKVPAILMAWYPGMEGGRAIADVLAGDQEPGGRLPFVIPTDPGHLPYFDADATSIVYDAWWGQRMLDRDGRSAAFPFGFGLGYTRFENELIAHAAGDDEGSATVRLRNVGQRDGATIAQVYAFDAASTPPVPQLIGFRRLELAAGGAADAEVALDLTPTRQRDPATRRWSRRPGDWRLMLSDASPTGAAVRAALAAGTARPL